MLCWQSAVKNIRYADLSFRQKNETGKQGVFRFRKRGPDGGLQTLWTLYEKRLSEMDLFDSLEQTPRNLLHKDGIVHYYGPVVDLPEAERHLDDLLNRIDWRHDQAVILGKHIITKRKVAWYGDKAFDYTYSNTTKRALPWTGQLRALKTLVEEKTGEKFNSCLLNLYHNGSEGMAWHSDGEQALKKNGAIASLTFGAERRFSFKHKGDKKTLSLTLENGSLLVMSGPTQSHWQHRLPPTKKPHGPRINLTFRTIVERN